jgi:hypothetical protein
MYALDASMKMTRRGLPFESSDGTSIDPSQDCWTRSEKAEALIFEGLKHKSEGEERPFGKLLTICIYIFSLIAE